MPKEVRVHVDADVIAKGIERSSVYCVIAEAIRKAIPDITALSVDLRTIRWSEPAKRKRYIFLTPTAAQQVIVNVDQGKRERIQPFTLRLRGAQIIDMRTAGRRRETQGEGQGKGSRTPRTFSTETKGRAVDIIGGKAPPRSPLSPSRERVFGAKYLVP